MAINTLLPNSTILQVGKIAQYLASNDIANKEGLFGGALNSNLALLIYMERTIVQWQYDKDPSDTTLRASCNYLWQLYGKYGREGLVILNGNTGGGIIPGFGTAPTPLQFIVSGSSPIITGESSKTIASFVGFNLIFARGNITQTTVNTEQSWYTWDRTTGAFTVTPEAQEGELFQLFPI